MDEQTGFNPKRRLCPDGTCTGVIGREGRCGECGKGAPKGVDTAAGSSWLTALDSESTADPDVLDGGNAALPASSAFATSSLTDGTQDDAAGRASGFDPSRRLCEDGTCVGIIGPSGVCSVCGRPAA